MHNVEWRTSQEQKRSKALETGEPDYDEPWKLGRHPEAPPTQTGRVSLEPGVSIWILLKDSCLTVKEVRTQAWGCREEGG